jgi:serine/threonine protein kinase
MEGQAAVGGEIISVDGIRLDKLSGDGKNGFVFDGRDLLLNRRVAVKIWPPRLDRPGKDPTTQALAEAQKLAGLKSDIIVPIYRAGKLQNNWVYAVMEFVDGSPLAGDVLAEVADAPGFIMRKMWWADVYRGLRDAERAGIYHGDLHEGNVLIRPFHATLIDFGTSALSGKDYSLKRHARLVNSFAKGLFPELLGYIAPLKIQKLAEPKYATWVVGEWIEAADALRELDKEISNISDEDLVRRLTLLAKNYSTNLIDLNRPIAMWLQKSGVSRTLLDTYAQEAEAELARRKERWESDTLFKGKP